MATASVMLLRFFILGITLETLPTRALPSEFPCSRDYKYIGGRCLYFALGSNSIWDAAKSYCFQVDGGNLLKLDNANLLNSIYQYIHLHDLPKTNYWIGGSDRDSKGLFTHIDGTPMTMGTGFWAIYFNESNNNRDYYSQEPQRFAEKDCVALDSNRSYYMYNDYCHRQFTPICEMPLYSSVQSQPNRETNIESSPVIPHHHPSINLPISVAPVAAAAAAVVKDHEVYPTGITAQDWLDPESFLTNISGSPHYVVVGPNGERMVIERPH